MGLEPERARQTKIWLDGEATKARPEGRAQSCPHHHCFPSNPVTDAIGYFRCCLAGAIWKHFVIADDMELAGGFHAASFAAVVSSSTATPSQFDKVTNAQSMYFARSGSVILWKLIES